MNNRLTSLAMLVCLASPLASAQMLQPGLWELTPSNVQVDGRPLPDMKVMLGQLDVLMTPEQRAQLQQGMAKQGISLGGNGFQACLTPEQVKTDDIPLQDPQSGCKQEITERKGNVWKFRFSCPRAQGAGEAKFLSDKEFLTKVNGTFNASGVQQQGSMESRAVWKGQDCGSVKPRT
ncbi:hypothetical protein D3C76_198520 [compost metagenome]